MVFYIEALFAPPVGPGKYHPLVEHMQVDREDHCFPPRGWGWQDEECGDSSGHGGNSGEATAGQHEHCAHAHEEEHAHGGCCAGQQGSYGATEGSSGSMQRPKGLLLGHMHHTRVYHPSSSSSSSLDKQQRQQPEGREEGHPPPSSLSPHLREQRSPAVSGQGSPNPNPNPNLSPTQPLLQQHRHERKHAHQCHSDTDSDHSGLHSLAGAFCLAAALGFHSVIEGLGLAAASFHDKGQGGQVRQELVRSEGRE